MEQINDLLNYPNRKIYQNSDWFSFSLDSVLLANFVSLFPSHKRILDIGSGTAPIPLILSLRTKAKIIGIEIQKDVAKLAVKSIQHNHLENQIQVVCDDIKNYTKQLESDSFDVIVSNPPYFKVADGFYKNKDDHKTIARHEINLKLEELFQCVRKLLKNHGTFAMVHRTERLIEILNLFQKNGIEPKKIQLIYPKRNQESNLVLIEGMKNGKVGLRIMPPLVIHDDNNQYTQQYLSFLKGALEYESEELQ